MVKIRNLFQKNPYLRHYLNVLFSIFRTFTLAQRLNIQKSKRLLYSNDKNKKILIAGSVSLNPDTFTEYIIAEGFLTSHKFYSLKCDSFLKACFNCKKYLYNSELLEKQLSKNGPGIICNVCEGRSSKYSNIFNSEELPLSKYLTKENELEIQIILNQNTSFSDIRNFKLEGINIGLHTYAATVRFYASPFIENEKYGKQILKNYFESALKTYYSVFNLFQKNEFDVVIVNHGIYIPQGIIAEVANMLNIKTLCFATGYRRNTFMVSYGKSYHFDFINKFDFEQRINNYSEEKILNYLKDRADGKQDWVLFHEGVANNQNLYEQYFDSEKNNIILFTNVLWDADVHFEEHYFNSMLDWLIESLNYLVQYDINNVIVRIHPGELKGFVKSRSDLYIQLKNKLSVNVFNKIKIINSNDIANSYELAKYANHIILYGSKLAIELAGLGYKVLVGGPSWTLNKNITVDPVNKKEYFKNLDQIVKNEFFISNFIDTIRARKFAHYVFFDRCIEIPFIDKKQGDPPIKISKTNYTPIDLYQFVRFLDNEQKEIRR